LHSENLGNVYFTLSNVDFQIDGGEVDTAADFDWQSFGDWNVNASTGIGSWTSKTGYMQSKQVQVEKDALYRVQLSQENFGNNKLSLFNYGDEFSNVNTIYENLQIPILEPSTTERTWSYYFRPKRSTVKFKIVADKATHPTSGSMNGVKLFRVLSA